MRAKLNAGSWFRILEENVSDSASFDNAFEQKLLEGFSPEAAMLSMVPPAFENDPLLSRDVRGALASLSQAGEPWDGPAALVFSDGQFVGAKLDRNGLRPLRYTLTHDGLLIAGSETGLVDLEESRIAERQRLGPGEMILANPVTGAVFRWREILKRLATQQSRNALPQVRQLAATAASARCAADRAAEAAWPLRLAGPKINSRFLFSALPRGKEADWSMGDDAPPAFLSTLPRTLWDYCKQRFAQVTNPPIDPLRESHVMSLAVHLPNGVVLPSPIIGAGQLAELVRHFWPRASNGFHFSCPNWSLGRALQHCSADYPSEQQRTPGPPPPFRSGHQQRAGRRFRRCWPRRRCGRRWFATDLWDVPLVVESAQVFDTHHVALLVAAGASAVVPYLADQFAEALEPGGAERMRAAINAGLAQSSGAHGRLHAGELSQQPSVRDRGLIRRFLRGIFRGRRRFSGAEEPGRSAERTICACTRRAFPLHRTISPTRACIRFRKGAELHANSPEIVRRLHAHVRAPDAGKYAAFEELAENHGPVFLRDLLETVPASPDSVEEVEPVEAIVRAFQHASDVARLAGPAKRIERWRWR